ncbi:restriction endonuclease [Amycolatopsis thermoflava]|uniref:restriction endonuclease n=1 Tax=Amycolatopsis thermoflava TaxID=84480 RepID=UPI0012F92F5C|nr:restriction endonuclease [Amycolatopsis thermoflava]
MSQFDPRQVRALLEEAAKSSTADARGKKYEELLSYVFSSVPGTLVLSNKKNYFGGEQVDLAIGHSGNFNGVPSNFLVECKNYEDPVDSKAVGYFLFICLSRGANLAVIAAANGLTGDPRDSSYAHSLALAAAAMGCRLIVVTKDDLLALRTTDDVTKLISHRYLDAFANGGIGAG